MQLFILAVSPLIARSLSKVSKIDRFSRVVLLCFSELEVILE